MLFYPQRRSQAPWCPDNAACSVLVCGVFGRPQSDTPVGGCAGYGPPFPALEINRIGFGAQFWIHQIAYWLRLTLQREPEAAPGWLLEIPYAKLDQVDFYPSNGQAVLTGSSRDLSTRPFFSRYFVFPVQVGVEPTQVYLRVSSSYSLTVPLVVWAPDAFMRDVQLTEMLQFLYFGGLAILSFYGLVLFVALRDPLFLIYGLYTLTVGLGIFAGNGFGRLLLWPASPGFDEVAQSGFFCIAAFFVSMFARKVLSAQGSTSRLLQGIRGCEWVFLAILGLIALQFLIPEGLKIGSELLAINAMVMGCLISLASFKAYRRKQPGIRFFFWSWVIFWLGIATSVLRAFGVLPSNALTLYAIQISTLFETVLLAMALADQLRLEVLARQAAQENTLAAQQQLLEMTQESEAKLKRAVSQRTEQLESALKTETYLREQYVQFGSMVAHEFRTPLNIIQSQLSVMRKEIERGIDQIGPRMQAVQSATSRLAVMFDKWLDNATMIQSSHPLTPKPQMLEPWLQAQLPSFGHLLSNHKLDLRLNGQNAMAMVDDYHLGVALSNLIDNACKYSPTDSCLTIEVLHKPDFAGISLKDEGCGIPKESHADVFEEFSRLHLQEQIPGAGLGLSIVQRIVLAHGGHITLESKPGEGSTFCIWLQRFTNEGEE